MVECVGMGGGGGAGWWAIGGAVVCCVVNGVCTSLLFINTGEFIYRLDRGGAGTIRPLPLERLPLPLPLNLVG